MKKKTQLIRLTTSFIIKHIASEWKLFIVSMFGISMGRVGWTLLPLLYKTFLNEITSATPDIALLHRVALGVLFLGIVVWIGLRLLDLGATHLESRIMKRIYDECFRYVHLHSYDFFINNFVGSIVKKVNRLPRAFESLFDRIFIDLYPLMLQVFISLYLLWTANTALALILTAWISIVFIGNVLFSRWKFSFDRISNAVESEVSGSLADTVANNINIQLFSKQNVENAGFLKLSDKWRKTVMGSWNRNTAYNAFQSALGVLLDFTLLSVGLIQWQQGNLTVGDFVLIPTIVIPLNNQMWNLGRALREIGRSYADASEMIEILETPHEITDAPSASLLHLNKAEIAIKNLNFCYPKGNQVFHDFSLTIPAGKKVALVSESGQGKSTLVKLLLRLYNLPSETIFIDGRDIMSVTLNSLRDAVALVPQDPILFHRTLADNIAYGKPNATMDEVIAASKKAHCHEFISKLPEQYQTFVGERGVKLSGGERQRVAIARAILKNAPILILDEATSSLDSESEFLIQDALTKLMKGKTTIVIAHRLSTVMQMDEIIVLDQGRIYERGTHGELIRKKGSHYKKLWEIQAGGFAA
ncbi:MAG: ABC transporter ATP-binding protein [bacterium]